MKIRVTEEQKIIQEAFNVLLTNLELSKVMGFWSSRLGEGDYLQLKDRLFEKETVSSLYDKISAYEDKKQK